LRTKKSLSRPAPRPRQRSPHLHPHRSYVPSSLSVRARPPPSRKTYRRRLREPFPSVCCSRRAERTAGKERTAPAAATAARRRPGYRPCGPFSRASEAPQTPHSRRHRQTIASSFSCRRRRHPRVTIRDPPPGTKIRGAPRHPVTTTRTNRGLP
ncbi:unnamed protein product, partial [Ectocarpus sp. 12 AP-2014]